MAKRLAILFLSFALIDGAKLFAGVASYSYDSLNRLTNVDYGNRLAISYTYDPAGNRLTYSAVTNYVATVTTGSYVTNDVFSDNFSGDSINTNLWTTTGNTVIETNQTMEVLTTVTDQPGTLTSKPFSITNSGLITISRSVYLHHDGSISYLGNTNFFTGYFTINVSGVPLFGVEYCDYDYSDASAKPTYGFFITRNAAGATSVAQQSDVSPGIPAIWDTWFNEMITYDPSSGQLQYFVNNALEITFIVGAMPAETSPTMTLSFQAYGWWTGHEQLFQNLSVTQTIATNSVATNPPETTVTDVTNDVFSDNFGGDFISTNLWTATGNTVIETNGTMEVDTTVTDQPGTLTSIPFAIANSGLITISRQVFLHHDDSIYFEGNNHFFTGYFHINVSNVPLFQVQYDDYDYSDANAEQTYGFFVTRNDASATYPFDQFDVSPAIPPLWDTWFAEKIAYDPRTGQLQYFINNVLQTTFNVGIMPISAFPNITLSFQAYGWWTGHEQWFQNLAVTQTINPTPQFVNPFTTNGVMSFDVLGAPTNSCLIEVSSNLFNWTPFSTGTFPASGLISIVDSNANVNPQQFYRAELDDNFVENFQNAPNLSNDWSVSGNSGSNDITYTSGNLLVQSSYAGSGSSYSLLSNDSFVGDIDLSVQLNHEGYGRTVIGLWSASETNWLACSILDTDDTAYLAFDSGSFSTQYEYSSAPYMDQWITLRIKTSGSVVQFFANGVLLETTSFTSAGPFRLGLSVSSVPWKSGDNETSFRLVNAIGATP